MAFDYGSEPFLPPVLQPTPHRDEPAEVAKRVADLEIMVERLLKWSKMNDPKTFDPNPFALPPNLLRGRDKGEKP